MPRRAGLAADMSQLLSEAPRCCHDLLVRGPAPVEQSCGFLFCDQVPSATGYLDKGYPGGLSQKGERLSEITPKYKAKVQGLPYLCLIFNHGIALSSRVFAYIQVIRAFFGFDSYFL